MAHELKPVMNNIIHRPMTNLEALKSLGSPKAKINALSDNRNKLRRLSSLCYAYEIGLTDKIRIAKKGQESSPSHNAVTH